MLQMSDSEFSNALGVLGINPDDTLEHYGTLGMRWGVRRGTPRSQTTAFRKSSKKHAKLVRKKNKLAVKGAKLALRGIKRNRGDLHMKGLRKQLKAARVQKRIDLWEKAMRENFSNVYIGDIDEKTLRKSEQFIHLLSTTKVIDTQGSK